MKKNACFFVTLLVFALFALHSQQVRQEEFIKLALWAEVDAYPGDFPSGGEKKPSQDPFAYPRERLNALAPFILEGMVYGWNFEYCPSDKARAVKEYFEFKPVHPFDSGYGKITWSDPWIAGNSLWFWMEFTRTPAMQQYYRSWESVNLPKIKGRGFGSLVKGFDGIREAYEEAAKLAVREYARGIVKNKPKEIRGRLLLTGAPRLFTDSGRYAVDLDFFLEVVTIVPYTQF